MITELEKGYYPLQALWHTKCGIIYSTQTLDIGQNLEGSLVDFQVFGQIARMKKLS